MSSTEVVVTVDGVPRPAVVVAVEGDRSRVRFRDAGSYREEWVPTSTLVPVESEEPSGRPVLKLVGLGVVALLGIALLLYPGGSDKRLADLTPTPSATPSASATPAPSATASPVAAAGPVEAVLFGDSFAAGRGSPAGTKTALSLAAASLGWKATVLAAPGTAYTTGGVRGGLPYAARLAREVRTAPDVLVIEGGASDTAASEAELAEQVGAAVDAVHRRFPDTKVVLMGPVAMEQPVDAQLVRVARVLAGVAKARSVPFVDPIGLHWVTGANHEGYTSSTGYYPNAAGHAYLGAKLAAALRRLAA